MKYLLLFLISAMIISCKTDTKKASPEQDLSYTKHVEEVLSNETLNFSNVRSIGIQLSNEYSIDNKIITKDELLGLNRNELFHIFLNHQYEGQRDTPRMVRKFEAFSHDYFKTNQLEPAYVKLNFYDGNLTGLNLGSETKGEFVANVYDVTNGKNLANFNQGDFDGIFYLGSNTAYDTFENVRLVVKIDTLLFQKEYTKEEMLKN